MRIDSEAREVPQRLQPRERLLKRGAGALSQRELLALLLSDRRDRSELERLTARLVRQVGLRKMAEWSAARWRAERGLGPAAAARLCAVFELGRRVYDVDGGERPQIRQPRDVYRQVRHLVRARKEQLVGLYLDAQNGLLHQETISVGSLNTTRTHPREVLHPAIVHLALGFILVHNHPSGCPDPSAEDLEFTQGMRRAAEMMGIELYDHVIVAKGGYTSLRERGLI